MKKQNFTTEDLIDFKDYEEVRLSGRYNMFDPRARRATGLSSERYCFVMKNYSELKEAAEQEKTHDHPD